MDTESATIVVFLAFGSIIAWALSAIAEWLINNLQRFQSLQGKDWLEEHGIFVGGTLAERFDVAWLIRTFQEIAWRLNRLVGFGILAFVILMLALLETEEIRHASRASARQEAAQGWSRPYARSPGSSADTLRTWLIILTGDGGGRGRSSHLFN